MAVIRRFMSTFTDTGDNLILATNSLDEQRRLRESAPRWAQKLSSLWILLFRLRRLLAGVYWPQPLRYAIYTEASPTQRQDFNVEKPTFRWPGR